jgi:hypothetical protein
MPVGTIRRVVVCSTVVTTVVPGAVVVSTVVVVAVAVSVVWAPAPIDRRTPAANNTARPESCNALATARRVEAVQRDAPTRASMSNAHPTTSGWIGRSELTR